MAANYYMVDKRPIFLTFESYSKVMADCGNEGEITEAESISNEFTFAGDWKNHKKVYKTICKYLERVMRTAPERFEDIINFDYVGEKARDNTFGLLNAVASYYKGYGFETISGYSADIRYTAGLVYYLVSGERRGQGGLRIKIDTREVNLIRGNLEYFDIIFSSGMNIHGDCGKLTIRYLESYDKKMKYEKMTRDLMNVLGEIKFKRSEIDEGTQGYLHDLGLDLIVIEDAENAEEDDYSDITDDHEYPEFLQYESEKSEGKHHLITQYINEVENCENFGGWVFKDGRAPYVKMEPLTICVMDAVFEVAKEYSEFDLTAGYDWVLQEHGIGWSDQTMMEADISEKGGEVVLALMIGVANAERFSDGTIVRFFSNGTMLKWMKRLKELDDQATFHI